MDMKNPMEYPEGSKDPQEDQLKEIVSFSKSNNISSEELFIAYKLAMGLSFGELDLKQPPRETVFALAKMMGEHLQNGLAVNRIAGLIDTKRLYEAAVEIYSVMVEGMQITEEEKKLLKSIVAEKKSGVITVVDDQTGEKLITITVTKGSPPDGYERNALAGNLIQYLQEYKDRKVGITFVAD